MIRAPFYRRLGAAEGLGHRLLVAMYSLRSRVSVCYKLCLDPCECGFRSWLQKLDLFQFKLALMQLAVGLGKSLDDLYLGFLP